MKRFLTLSFITIVIIICAAQILLPPKIKVMLLDGLNKMVTTEVTTDTIGLNLIKGSVSFSGLKIANPPGFKGKYFLVIDKGRVKLSLYSLLFGDIDIQNITVEKPRFNIVADRGSTLNTSVIFRKKTASGGEAESIAKPSQKHKRKLRIKKIAIKNGELNYTNFKLNPNGASLFLNDINVSVKNLRPSRAPQEMPTSARAYAKLPSRSMLGDLEIITNGNFMTDKVDFDLGLSATDIPISYFLPFYGDRSPVLGTSGAFNLKSSAHCRKNELNTLQTVEVRNLELKMNPRYSETDLAFGLPVKSVIGFFIENQGNVDFDFKITGSLKDPEFHLIEALKKVFAKSIGKVILRNITKVSQVIFDRIKENGNIKDIGKDFMDNILKQIIKQQGSSGH